MDKVNQKSLTIDDVAEALGISKTTVSRAISGKGRIGEETRQRVLEYIEKCKYKPNPMAKGLANQKTYNICCVIPGDTSDSDLPFFQRCMSGVCDVAMASGYEILITQIYEEDITQLKRIVENKKADGFILERTLVNDPSIRYLKECGLPFTVIGSTEEKDVIQIDNDHETACRELVSILAMKGIRRMALIGGPMNHVVNRSRLRGYELGLEASGLEINKDLLFLNNRSSDDVERAIDGAMSAGAGCLVCMDDSLCYRVLMKLRRDGIIVPSDIKVASFYNSMLIDTNDPPVTCITYNPRELGSTACRILVRMLKDEDVEEKTYLGYDVMLKGSTK